MDELKLFTPKEANQTLPLVKRIVSDILSTGDRIRALSAEIGKNSESNPQIIQWMNQLEELFEELELLGCSYKDWNFTVGLVDFPSVIGGQQVFLCWRSDEKELKYYHEIDAGFTGRKLIPKEELS